MVTVPTVLHTTSTSANRTAIILDGAHHIIIDSLKVDVSGGTYGWGIVLTNGADNNIIRKCTVTTSKTSTSSNYAGIIINGTATSTADDGNNGNNNLISGNTITGGYYGIYVYGSTDIYNTGNIIENNTLRDQYSTFIYSYGNTNLLITGNDISRPTRTSVTTTYGVDVESTLGTVIEKNMIHNLFDAATSSTSTAYGIIADGAGISAAQPNVVMNNLVYNINNGNGTIYGVYADDDNNWNFYHNTIVLNNAASTAGTTYGCYTSGVDVNVKNNLIYITRGGTGTKYCVYFSTEGVGSSDNNDLYINAPAGTNNIGYYGVAFPSLAAWKGAGLDANSVSLDPQFVNTGAAVISPQRMCSSIIWVKVQVLRAISLALPEAPAHPILAPLNLHRQPVLRHPCPVQ